jgi:mannose-1-phosphate guanylyltransferase/mannose-6-phosphate isomerase
MISVILSGGSGTRLWPVSRAKWPKQFCDLFTESLFSRTCRRLEAFGEVQICTSKEMKELTEKSARENHHSISQYLYEPIGRNTAPAVALICQNLLNKSISDEIIGIFPSDHWIEKKETFKEVIELAVDCAKEGQIVTIGIEPNFPSTGFGYIERDSVEFISKNNHKSFLVKSFKEKPNLETAQKYLASSQYSWNSGMFVFSLQTMVKAFQEHMPTLWKRVSELKSDFSNIEEIYNSIKPESLDYGIMEHAKNIVCIPCDLGWSDLGSWDDISNIKNKNDIKNFATSIEHNSSDCFAFSNQAKTICLNGVKDLIIVDTQDALLISAKGESQDIKKILEKIQTQSPDLASSHVFEHRPWGQYQSLWEEESFKTKVIQIDPQQQISYQSHAKRSETWIIVEGAGVVTLNDQPIDVKIGSVVIIPLGSKHRIKNTGTNLLKFVEVQLGTYFGEDDITRFQDDYQRL